MTGIILFSIIGVVVGAALGLFYAKGRAAALKAMLDAKEKEMGSLRADFDARLAQSQREREKLYDENKNFAAEKLAAERELAVFQEQVKQSNEERTKQFQQHLNLVQEQLENATQQLLRRRADELAQQNSQQMQAVINPLKENIDKMRAAFDSNRDTNNKNTASLEKAIETILKHTADIGNKADKLASALRNDNKAQGNWGELVLDRLLESEGLIEGTHFDKQTSLRNNAGKAIIHPDTGSTLIPDVVLHYPDGKDVVIDSKTSLKAFVDYQNATSDEARDAALKQHLNSITRHVNELSKKDYSSYIKAPRQSLNYVIMFVPHEGALQLALANAPHLWRDAFEKGVCITGELTLMTFLRIIQMAWTQMAQNKNQEEIVETARMLLDRICDFIKYFDAVGLKIQEAATYHAKAADKLSKGRQSVTGAANKLQQLGVKHSSSKSLPQYIE